MMGSDEKLRQSLRRRLGELGCQTEGGLPSMADLVAIDVPGSVVLSDLSEILDPYRTEQQIELMFSTLRHADTHE